MRNNLPASSAVKKKPAAAIETTTSTAAAATLPVATTTAKDIQYKLIKLKSHIGGAPSASQDKDFEEKYSAQLNLEETYQVEYDDSNLQGALIVNSDGIGAANGES